MLKLINNNNVLNHQSPTVLALGNGFTKDNFSMDWGVQNGFRMIQLPQLHLRSSDINSSSGAHNLHLSHTQFTVGFAPL